MTDKDCAPPAYVSLRYYVDERFRATELAISKTEAAANKLHDFSNNLASRMVTKDEYRNAHEALDTKISLVQKMVWVGLGIILTLQVVAIIFWRKP